MSNSLDSSEPFSHILSTVEIAKRLDLTTDQVRYLIRQDRLPGAFVFNHRHFITTQDLESYQLSKDRSQAEP